jgi:hypothetical protein
VDVSTRTQVFGDDQYLFLIEVRNDGTPSNGRALRARDGVSVQVPDFAELYKRKLRTVGRDLLLSESDAQGGLVLRLHDLLTGKDRWRKTFTPKSLLLIADDAHGAGVVEPGNGGKVTVVDLPSGREVLAAKVDPKHLDKVNEARLFSDGRQFYLALNRPADPPPGVNFWMNSALGMRRVPVNGWLYTFDRATGAVRWVVEVPHQQLIVDQLRDMPALVFVTHYNRANPGPRPTQHTGVKAIDKEKSKLVLDKTYQSVNNQNYYFSAVNTNPKAGQVELVSYSMKIIIEPAEGNKP